MKENIVRALSGIVFILLLLVAILYSNSSFVFLFVLFSLIVSNEFGKLLNLSISENLGLSAFFWLIFFVFKNIDFPLNRFLTVVSFVFSLWLLKNLFSSKFNVIKKHKSIKQAYVLLYILLPFGCILQFPFINGIYEPRLMIGVFVLIWSNDTFAYICGKSFGKRKLFERISPKKTIEGFMGGAVLTLLIAMFLSYYFTFLPLIIWLIVSIIISVFGTIGDLIESKFKRLANVKDSGSIMPGHGGLLDRLDSLIYSIVFLMMFFQLINL